MDLNKIYSIIDRDIKSMKEFLNIRDELIRLYPKIFIKIDPKEAFDTTLAIANLEINIENTTSKIVIKKSYLIENNSKITIKDLIY